MLDGHVLATAEWPVGAAVGRPRPAGELRVPAAGLPPDTVLVWEFTWRGPDGDELDREAVLTATGADWAPLLDLPPATLDVSAVPGAVRVAHRGGPAVVGLRLVPAGDDPVRTGGDPRPLLPGETRTFAVDAPAAVRLESWNTDPVHLDVPPKETPA
jgi:hypothetical protein